MLPKLMLVSLRMVNHLLRTQKINGYLTLLAPEPPPSANLAQPPRPLLVLRRLLLLLPLLLWEQPPPQLLLRPPPSIKQQPKLAPCPPHLLNQVLLRVPSAPKLCLSSKPKTIPNCPSRLKIFSLSTLNPVNGGRQKRMVAVA